MFFLCTYFNFLAVKNFFKLSCATLLENFGFDYHNPVLVLFWRFKTVVHNDGSKMGDLTWWLFERHMTSSLCVLDPGSCYNSSRFPFHIFNTFHTSGVTGLNLKSPLIYCQISAGNDNSCFSFLGFLQFLSGFYDLLQGQVLCGEYLPLTVSVYCNHLGFCASMQP